MARSQPFDALAPSYDAAFTASPIARYLRARIHQRLLTHLHPGDTVLELGCGTGEDALFLARHGINIVATDSSEAMLAVARDKTKDEPRVTLVRLDLRTPPPDPLLEFREGEPDKLHFRLPSPEFGGRGGEGGRFDAAFANFGPLNCLDDWPPLAEWLARQVKPGGVVAFGMLSPLCLWEIGWHALHLDFKTAARRLRGNAAFQPQPSSPPISIAYPSVGRLTRDFSPWFRPIHLEGVGLFLPPSDAYAVVEKHPRLLRALTLLEERFARHAALAPFADHYWIEMVRQE